MPFKSGLAVPGGLTAADFLLEPLGVEHCALDYAALMSSRIRLQELGWSGWPRADFTFEENCEDLARHQREHQEGSAFTFTVLSPTREVCFGCLYVRAQEDLIVQREDNVLPDMPVAVFWVTDEQRRKGLDLKLIQALRPWFAASWPWMPAPGFLVTPGQMHDRQLLAYAGFDPVPVLTHHGRMAVLFR